MLQSAASQPIESAANQAAQSAAPAWRMPYIMGILNVTPDSFYDGGKYYAVEHAVQHGINMIKQGADIIDIGGESTRPGAQPISEDEERNRIISVIQALRPFGKTISVDTRHASVMQAAIEAGARMINDVSALTHDPASLKTILHQDVHVVLMHMQGTPQTMQQFPSYNNVVDDIYRFFEERIDACLKAGIQRQKLIIDPGIGFGKTIEHNIDLLRSLDRFRQLDCSLLLGVSRKSFIARISRDEPPSERLPGSIAAAIAGVHKGARIIRVHDVAETVQALQVYKAVQ